MTRRELLGGEFAREIRRLLTARGVLLFRDVHLDDEEQLAFSAALGRLVPQSEDGVYKVTLDPALSDTADLLRSTFGWHFDGTSEDVPPLASILNPRQLSQVGGQTEFANMYAAYEALPDARKLAIEALQVVHMRETLHRLFFPNPTETQLELWRISGEKERPLVWTHESGRKSLVLGLTATRVVGMEPVESRALLDTLQSWATQPQFVYRHEWQLGNLLIWDNTGVLHRVEPYPMDSGRLLHRTTLAGEESLA